MTRRYSRSLTVAVALLALGPGTAGAEVQPAAKDPDLPAQRLLTKEQVQRWMPVSPLALNASDPKMRALARAVAQGTTSEAILRAYSETYRREYPFDKEPEALRREHAMQARKARGRASLGPRKGGSWTSLGPKNIAGRMTSIAIHPTDPRIMYAGAANGGVWKTTDGGANWVPLPEPFLPGSDGMEIGCIAIDPINPEIVYAGTGVETNFNVGNGLLKSTDGGATWTAYDLLTWWPCTATGLVIDPGNSARLWAAEENRLGVSTDSGQTWSAVSGTGGLPEDNFQTIVVSRKPPYKVLVAGIGRIFDDTPNAGFYRSTDAGTTWTLVTSLPSGTGFGKSVAAQSVSNPLRMYAAVATSGGDDALAGVYRSDDEGLTWVQVGSPEYLGSQLWHNLALAVDAANPDLVYLGGTPLYRSTDAGATWSLIGSATIHVDQQYLVSPAPGVVWTANDGGIYSSTDSGATFVNKSETLVTTQYYHITTDAGDDRYAIGGTQDNGTHKFQGSYDWFVIEGSDGGYNAIDWERPNVWYGSWQFLNMLRSRNRGLGMLPIGGGIDPNDPRDFIAPFILDRSEPRNLLAGTNRLWRSTDQGDSFTAISPQLTGTEWDVIRAIDNCAADGRHIYVGTSDGKVWHTRDGGATWRDVSQGLPQAQSYLFAIAVNPKNPEIAYVAPLWDYLWRTGDGGKTWARIGGSLPTPSILDVLVPPDQPNTVIAAGEFGVYRSDDEGKTWYAYGEDLPNVQNLSLSYATRTHTLRVGTFGRGVWQLADPGACLLAPSFAGLAAVSRVGTDRRCKPQLSWPAAVSACAAAPGVSYNVYRSKNPLFDPSPANLIKSGITATTWTDTSALQTVPYYYIVRAEDGESGHGGPANGGREDLNQVMLWIDLGSPIKGRGFHDDGGDTGAWMTPAGNWTVDALRNSTHGGRYAYHSAPHGSITYEWSSCADLVTPDLVLAAGARLSYRAAYNLEYQFDGVVVEISTDGGSTWADLAPSTGYPSDFSGTLAHGGNSCAFPPDREAFNGPPDDSGMTAMLLYTSDLSAYAGMTVSIRWRMSSDDGDEFEGFVLDDISVLPAALPADCTCCRSHEPIGSPQEPLAGPHDSTTSLPEEPVEP